MPKVNSAKWSAFQTLASSVLTPRDAGVLRARYQHWHQHKGTEWVVSRLKALTTVAKLQIQGSSDQALEVLSKNHIAHRQDGFPSGVEGQIVVRAGSKNPRVSKKAFAVLRAYTGLFLTEASQSQIEKSEASINSPYTGGVPSMLQYAAWLEKYSPVLRDFYHVREPLKLEPVGRLRGMSSYPNLVNLDSRDKRLPYESMVASMMSKGKVPESLLKYYGKDFALRQVARHNQSISGCDTYGKVVVLQEGGAKGRVICSPNAWVQYYMYPLHQYLFNLITKEEQCGTPKLYGISCVTDQLRGVYLASSRMDEGGFVASVDLSSATDRFPLWLQNAFLTGIGLGSFAEALIELRGPYDSPTGEPWFYRTGQPMGVYGSFPLFHLVHLFVLRWSCMKLGLDPDVAHFAVLGDDVLIFNEELLVLYHRYLEFLGVEVSRHKSYSGNIAEFAGFIIQQGVKPYRPYKWGKDLNFGPVINTLYTLGASSSRLGNWWKRSYDLLVETVGLRDLSLSPLVPDSAPLVGVEATLSGGYLRSLVSKLESRSKTAFIHSLIPPGQINLIGEECDLLVQNDAGFIIDGIDPANWLDRPSDWSNPSESFMKDPLIKSILERKR